MREKVARSNQTFFDHLHTTGLAERETDRIMTVTRMAAAAVVLECHMGPARKDCCYFCGFFRACMRLERMRKVM